MFYIILIPTILFSLFLILVELGNSYEVPGFLNIDIYTVVSDSMSPKLKTNDIIIVKKGYNNNEFKVGNIITFKRKDGEIITHRISKIISSNLQNAYKTKGDNNDTEDEDTVLYNDIIGKVIYVMPRLGNLIKVLKNKVFFASCIILLVLITYYDMRIKKRKQERKLVREKYEKNLIFIFRSVKDGR